MTFATKTTDMPTLTTEEQQELEDWIGGLQNCKLPTAKWPRLFADGVQLVRIIHSFNPKLVELHNYSPRNGFAQKLTNWQTLNRKVLRKLGFNFDDSVLQSLARADNDAIHAVLYGVMKKIRTSKDTVICGETDDSDIVVVSVKQKINGQIENRPQKMISFAQYEALQKNFDEREVTLGFLHQKVTHLENMLHLKDQRIADLEKQGKTTLVIPNYTANLLENLSLDQQID